MNKKEKKRAREKERERYIYNIYYCIKTTQGYAIVININIVTEAELVHGNM